MAAILLAAFSISAQAQEQDLPETDPYKREIGFGTNILLNTIFNSESGPVDFMYKWKGGSGYWRLGTSIGYSEYDNLRNNNFYSENRYLQSYLNLGREWRQYIGKRWLVNYGIDLVGSYGETFRKTESFSNYVGQEGNILERVNVQKSDEHQYGVSLRPLLGILFKINERLYLGTEASFSAGFLKKAVDLEVYTVDNGARTDENVDFESRPTDGYDINIRTKAASNLFLYYRF